MTAQFITQLLEEIRQILVDFVRFHPCVFQRVQDLLHERLRSRRIRRDETGRLVRCRSRCVIRLLGGRRGTDRRLRDRRSRRRRPTRDSYGSRRGRCLQLLVRWPRMLTGRFRRHLRCEGRYGSFHIHIDVQT